MKVMKLFDKFKRVKKSKVPSFDELAISSAEAALPEDTAEPVAEVKKTPSQDKAEKTEKEKKEGLLKKLPVFIDTFHDVKERASDIYDTWIKPVHDNWEQIKRRCNALVTIISAVFFIAYVPMLLFGKMVNGLSIGWDVALYTCIGVYVCALIAFIAITAASGATNKSVANKRLKRASKIILFFVRIASTVMSIMAITISGLGESGALNVAVLVFAIVSLVFSAISLVFGGVAGFLKWLISPAKIRRRFSFVAFEWRQAVDDGLRGYDKRLQKSVKKYREKIDFCLDTYLLPQFGKKYIDVIDSVSVVYILGRIPAEDKNTAEWVVSDLFSYAYGCGYVPANICDGLELSKEVVVEGRGGEERSRGLFSLFKK